MTQETSAPPGRRRAPWLATGMVALLLVAGGVTAPFAIAQQAHAAAQARYEAAADGYRDAVAGTAGAADTLLAASGSAATAHTLSARVLDIAVADYVDARALALLAAEHLALTDAIEVADAAPRPPGPLGPAPDDPDALERRAEQLRTEAAEVRELRTEFLRLAEGVVEATDAVTTAGEAFMAALPGSVASVDASFPSATNLARIDYREAAAQLPDVEWGPDAVTAVERHVAVASALATSHAAEEAQKAGPLYANRTRVEAFARSIAGGVLLDFDWAPVVNGYGEGGSYGGTATWNTAHGGYSTITLSDSVAAMWDDNPAVASLVAHEVGHSITGKCMELFIDRFDSEAEVFATAWAIGMGHNENGSGESIYGRPSDHLIELSLQCR